MLKGFLSTINETHGIICFEYDCIYMINDSDALCPCFLGYGPYICQP